MKIKSLKPKKKKDFRYWQTDLKPLGDFDRDKKINLLDCYPYDPSRQGLTEIKDTIKTKLHGVGERIQDYGEKREQKKIEKGQELLEGVQHREKMPKHVYLIVKIRDDKWYNWGAFTTDQIRSVMEETKQRPDVEMVITSTNKNEASVRNRKIMTGKVVSVGVGVAKTAQHFKEGGEAYLKGYEKRQQMKENVERGLKIRKQGVQDLRTALAGPSGKPPSPPGWWRKAPQQQVVVQQQMPMEQQQAVEYPSGFVEERKLPPGVQRYDPVSKDQSYVPKRQFVGRQFSLGQSERSSSVTPMIEFKTVRMPNIRFGRRTR